MNFERVRVHRDLSADRVVFLASLAVHKSDLVHDFADLTQRGNFANIVAVPIKELLSCLIDFTLFFLRVLTICDVASVSEGIVHRKLLLKLFDLVLVATDHQSWIRNHIHGRLVLDTHHSCGEFES